MKFILSSLILLFLSHFILSASSSCTINITKSQNYSSYSDCKSISTSSDNKLCCYVKGKDKDENDISACQEFTGTEKGVAIDLFDLEKGHYEFLDYVKYFLEVDCNFTKKISLCNPDAMKSDSPLSYDICKNNYYVTYTGVDDDMDCCYLTAKNVQNKDVYSCVGIDDYFNTKADVKNELESGKYERIGALKDIKITCKTDSKKDDTNDTTDSNDNGKFIKESLFVLMVLFSLIL